MKIAAYIAFKNVRDENLEICQKKTPPKTRN